uniref:Serpentine receptor class gamma n=1 Tax=Caenorhabditis tropicalis TaxID=1561998 RepID=A0A1I7SYB8_9PELO
MTISCGYFYYHVYKLLQIVTSEIRISGSFLLYQFVPIHTIMLIHSTGHLVGLAVDQFLETDLVETVDICLFFVFAPLIPSVVSLSYISCNNNIRAFFRAIWNPIWRELTT